MNKSFNIEALKQADRLLEEYKLPQEGDNERIDLTGLKTYAIDDENTDEIDDAISLELTSSKITIWIHIADPCRLVKEDSPLDIEAMKRATSIYFVEGVKPMFPIELSHTIFSLQAQQRSAALSCGLTLGTNGEITSTKLSRSWVQPNYNLTYQEADELIDLKPPGEEDISELFALLKRRKEYRLNCGAISLEQSEGKFKKNSEGEIYVKINDYSPSRQMVSEAMILMGSAVAIYAKNNNLAIPYRTQISSKLYNNENIDLLPKGPIQNSAIKFNLGRSSLSPEPGPHSSLGLEAYVQMTSPIRRYSDLLAHRQVIAFLLNQDQLSKEAVRTKIQTIEPLMRESAAITRENQKKYFIRWLKEHGQLHSNVCFLRWMKKTENIALLYFESVAIESICKLDINQQVEPGSNLNLNLQYVDEQEGDISFKLDGE